MLPPTRCSDTVIVGAAELALARTVSMWPLIGMRTRTVARCLGPLVRARRTARPLCNSTSVAPRELIATLTSKRPLEPTGSRRRASCAERCRCAVAVVAISAEAPAGNAAAPTARAMIARSAVLGCPTRGGSDRTLSAASDCARLRRTYDYLDVRQTAAGRPVDAGAVATRAATVTARRRAAPPRGSPGRRRPRSRRRRAASAQ